MVGDRTGNRNRVQGIVVNHNRNVRRVPRCDRERGIQSIVVKDDRDVRSVSDHDCERGRGFRG